MFDLTLTARQRSLRLRLLAEKRRGGPRKPDEDGTAAAPATPDPTPMPSMGGAEAPLD
ncbi:hypothetical protein [Sphingomonas sp. PAMC26645]|uniref:hypothetical protein n=1 Tax=Sphingomonas sp. PAMC26645 TaxID=2565555 RepID=UPI001446A128|nr:hypothetical protein [Sphingomonas sp. PAMC26645]